ncbi:hypothetical protein [Clostridium sp. FP1]|nr:hypothetical protein [Clostridium sp. FP1]
MKHSFFKLGNSRYIYRKKPLFLNTFKTISDLDYFLITNKQI